MFPPAPRFWVAPILLFLLIQPAFAQEIKPVAAHVAQLHQNGNSFPAFQVFSAAPYKKPSDFDLKTQPLRLEQAALDRINSEHPEVLSLELPWQGSTLRIELYHAPVLVDNFSVLTSGKESFVYTPGVYYRGIIANEPQSVAAISFFEDEVIGVIAHPAWGNLNLGRMDRPGNRVDYVLFNDQDIPEKPPFECAGPLPPEGHLHPTPNGARPDVSGCVQIFFECDYELFQNKGSVGNTINYVTGFFNVVSTLYANETISVAISQIYVWTTPDSYPVNSSSNVLDAFRTLRTSFTGDLAHLVGLGGGSLGGIAYIDVLCVPGYNYAYSNISSTYSAYPTYSWTVEVVTHETGHNLGSYHTHWCGWSGGALDNCYATEGGCAAGPPPSNGGTIMSYCHLTAYGINFTNGFGTQPGDAIRTGVTNASCLSASCPSSSCTAPTSLTVGSITSTSAVISWNAISGAASYNLQYRISPAGAWTTVNTSNVATYTLTGLSPATKYEVQVQTVCAGGSSAYFAGLIFLTLPSACTEPSGITVSGQTSSTADVNWTENGSAAQWQIQYGNSGFSLGAGTIVTSNTKPYTLTGLLSGTAYDVYLRSICGGALGNSTWVGPVTFNTPVANDDPSGAILLTVDQACPGTNIYNNLGSGTSPGEFSPTVANGGYWDTGISNTVWFKFVAPTSGSVKISTDISPLGSLKDTEIALYSSSNPTSVNELLVSNEDGGSLGSGWATTAYYSGLTPGSMYYIQVDGWNTDVGNFCITVAQTYSIPNPGTACTSYSQALVDGSTAPDKWFNVYHKPSQYNIGQTVAAVKSSDNLGTVTVQELLSTSVQSAPNGVKYMQRYYNVNCTQNKSAPKQVRLFYTDTELNTYTSATGMGGNTAEDLNISHYDGTVEDCTPNNNSGGTTTLLTSVSATTIGSSGVFYLQFESPGFSEMAAIFGLTALPVELIYFRGKTDGPFNRLEWATAYEKNVAAFALERSPDGYGQWREMGRKSPANEPKASKDYFLDDLQPLARGYYRLKIIDQDGSIEYSNIVVLERSVPDGLRSLYPNPAGGTLFAEYQVSTETETVFRLISADGRLVLEQAVELAQGLNILPFPLDGLPAGLYYLTVPGSGGQAFVKK